MSKTSNHSSNKGCIIIIIIVAIIYAVIDNTYFKPKQEAEEVQKAKEEAQELTNFWSKPTIDFFKKFNCEDLKFEEKEFKIYKFLAIENLDYQCQIGTDTNSSFEDYKLFKDYYTRKINDANIIVWIVEIRGKEEGTYTGGEKAIRLCSEINFIDKNTKIICKKTTVDYLGEAPQTITRTSGSHFDEIFGEKDFAGISVAISEEISKSKF